MGRRGPTIADTALELIKTGGPQTLEELAVAVAAAGRTSAQNPVNAVLSAIARDDRFLESDNHWLSLVDLLDGAISTHRLTDIERLYQVVVFRDEDTLVERIARGSAPSERGGRLALSSVGSVFDLPWDDETAWATDVICLDRSDLSDPDATWDFLTANRSKSVLVIPDAQMPNLQPHDLLGVAVRGGSLEVIAVTPVDIEPDHVARAVALWADLIKRGLSSDSDGSAIALSVRLLLETIAVSAPEILRRPLPPTAEVISAAGFYLCDGRITSQRPSSMELVPARSNDHYDDHMTIRMTATDLKARLLGVLERVAAGEVVEVTKRGRVIARVVPATASHGLRGAMRGMATTNASDDELFTTGEPWNVA